MAEERGEPAADLRPCLTLRLRRHVSLARNGSLCELTLREERGEPAADLSDRYDLK
jgi:hypothetical protein